jgi:flagellar hook-length control protein FliK
MALAMVSQSLAQAASTAAQTTAAAGGNVSAAKSDTAQIPAALAAAARVASAAAATVAGGAAGGGTVSGASAGAATADDADAADGLDGSAATAQKLFALLTQGEDAGLGTQASKDAAQSGDGSQNNSPGNSDNGPTVNSSTATGHLTVGSHFSVQHGTNDAKATVDVKTPVGSTAWTDELGGKITWMAHQGIESASLRLSPAHLGPVEVRISVQDGGASVWFGAAQADTRTALEQALPRLREMFSAQGLTLADANVSRDPPRQQQPPTANGVAAVTGVSEITAPQPSSSLSLRIGLLDTYA